jgi:SAM-dependent methyltransferase
MPLFQKNVFRTHWEATRILPACQDAYKRFQAHFGDTKMQKNILSLKEEQYQEGFLRDLFVTILGYTLAPQPDHNLTTELKNPNSNEKVDGAIVKGDKVFAVIELKSAKTENLHGVREQAFHYKSSHEGCKYVIISNFTKLRFYIDYNNEFLEFDLFDMTEEAFAQLYTVLYQENIFDNLPEKIKKESTAREDELTKAFYEHYQLSRDELFGNILGQNKQYEWVVLFERTQKLLDRLIFMLFAQHKRLLPANLVGQILVNWEILKKIYKVIPLYDMFKNYFAFLNKGNKGDPHTIFGYNGGLFAPDEVLDSIEIDDVILKNVCETLNNYDFDSDIDVNVLGHIFEYSLSTLDEQRKKLEKGDTDITEISLRKKEGVFYTPRYITQYMVRSTLGELCKDKKTELELVSIDFDNTDSEVILSKVLAYETWLHSLKVVDPSCGSGAFLNQVLEFLIGEYTWVGLLKKTLEKPIEVVKNDFFAPLPVPVEEPNFIHPILENNIFGVDLNPDSIQITKLSLWLRTAQHKKKLNHLNSNIKCGNSLIDDKSITEKAFDWEKEFSKVFSPTPTLHEGEGVVRGFDLIIGNPPYVRQEIIDVWQKDHFKTRYKNVYSGVADLYVYFYSKALEMLKPEGTLAYITPNKWFKTKYGEELRKLLQPLEIQQIVDFFENRVFEDASTEPQIIVLKNKASNQDFDYFPITEELAGKVGLENFAEHLPERLIVEKKNLEESEWVFTTGEKQYILDTIAGKKGLPTVSLKEYSHDSIYYGVKTGLNKAFIIDRATKEELIKKDIKSADLIKPYIQPTDIKKWHLEGKEDSFMIFTRRGTNIDKYPAIKKYLTKFKDELAPKTSKKDTQGRKAGDYEWFEIQDVIDYYQEFDNPKLMYIHTALEHYFYYDTEGYYINNSAYFISNADLFLCAYLNSPIFKFYKKLKFVAYGNADEGGRNKLDYNKMVNVPVLVASPAQKQPIEQKVKDLQALSKQMYEVKKTFLETISQTFKPEKISKKLENWYELDKSSFFDELKKQKATYTPQQQMSWLSIFAENQKQAQALWLQIRRQEQELNEMLYALYGFSPAEITLIEHI